MFVLPAIIFGANITSSKITLQSAINIARTYFDVPASFTNFSFNYNTYDDHQNWNLTWSSPQINNQSNGSLNITINASNGNVESMNYWNQSKNQPKYVFPKISRDKARKIAETFLNKIDSNKIDQLIHINNTDQLVPLTLPQSYVFEWERIVNGIPFSNDDIQISVDAQSGRIIGYQMNWTNPKFPNPSDILTPKQAKSAFLSDDLLMLEYYPLQSTTQSTAILVYTLSQNNGAIDAITGKSLKLQNDQWLNEGYFSNVVNSEGKAPFKENNQAQLAETYKFIDGKTAVDDLKKIVEIPSNLELTSANLAYNPNDGRIVWNLYWWNQNEAKATITGTVTSIFAGIDAVNGSIDHLYVNYQNPSPKATLLNKNEAQKIARLFLKKAQPTYFTQSKWNPQAGYKPQGAYNFVYDRIVNGIPFPANSMEITVSNFGMVTSYSSNWSNVSFESTDGIIPLSTAKEIFLNYRPLALNYVRINNQNNSTSTIRLVYLPEIRNPIVSNLLNAKTGEPLNWNGMSIDQNAMAYHFNDLNLTEYATYISYLGQAGLFGEYGNLFMPSGKITVENFIKNLLALKNGAVYVNSLSPKQIMDTAVYDDLVPSTINPKKFLDEETLSEIMVRFLGLKIVAKDYGYQTLARKLGIISGSSSDVTRLEAAISIIRAIKINSQN